MIKQRLEDNSKQTQQQETLKGIIFYLMSEGLWNGSIDIQRIESLTNAGEVLATIQHKASNLLTTQQIKQLHGIN